LVDDRPGQGDSLLLTAGELVGLVVEPLAQADALERADAAFLALLGGNPGVDHRQHHVFQGGELLKEMKLLKDESQFAVAQIGELIVRELLDGGAVEAIAATAGAIQAAQDVHGRALA